MAGRLLLKYRFLSRWPHISFGCPSHLDSLIHRNSSSSPFISSRVLIPLIVDVSPVVCTLHAIVLAQVISSTTHASGFTMRFRTKIRDWRITFITACGVSAVRKSVMLTPYVKLFCRSNCCRRVVIANAAPSAMEVCEEANCRIEVGCGLGACMRACVGPTGVRRMQPSLGKDWLRAA